MPRMTYDAETKATLTKAAASARQGGKTWKEAHEAAVAAGYKGSVQGIIKLMRVGGKKQGKPGRPAGRPRKLAAAGSNNTDISGLIDRLVGARINAALDKAIRVLQDARH